MESSPESRWLVYTEVPLDCYGLFETEATARQVCVDLQALRDAHVAAEKAWYRHPLVDFMTGLWVSTPSTPPFLTREISPV